MRRMRVAVAAALGCIFLSAPVFAQFQPQITAFPPARPRLNLADLDADIPINLTWSFASVPDLSYRWEITYDERSTEVRNAELIVLDESLSAGLPEGTAGLGMYAINIRPSQIIRPTHYPERGGADDTPRDIVLQVFRGASKGEATSSSTFVWTFRYDTRGPTGPASDKIVPGENNVEVHWTAPTLLGIAAYEVLYCPGAGAVFPELDDEGTKTSTRGELGCAVPELKKGIGGTARSTQITGLENGQIVSVAIRGVDDYGNTGDPGPAAEATPAPVTDFFELYARQGGGEDGGFCFVATAAHGSYAHPVVKLLRRFRDDVLLAHPAGATFVWAYYSLSPPAARAIAESPDLGAAARLALLPLALLALLALALPFIGGATVAWLLLRRLRSGAAVALAITLAAGTAEAKRPDADGRLGFGFELKGGPYLPAVGNAGASPDAFVRIYGSNPNPLFSLALDVQLYRGFGTAGVGGSFGFMQFVGKSFFGDDLAVRSNDTTVFNIAPLSLVGFYRFDWLADNTAIPLVPYVRGGLAYHVWWVTTDTGDVSRIEGGREDGSDAVGRGGKFGVTGTLGIAILLNALEPHAAQSLFSNTGIRGTYIFAELQANHVDGFGAQGFDLSDTTWNLGAYFEF